MGLGVHRHIKLYTMVLWLVSWIWYGTKGTQSIMEVNIWLYDVCTAVQSTNTKIYMYPCTNPATQQIDPSPPGYGQPSDPLSYPQTWSSDALHKLHWLEWHPIWCFTLYFYVFLEFWSCKLWERSRFTSLSWLPHHRKTCWLQAICPNLHHFTGKNGWLSFPIFGKSCTEHMTLVAIRHLAIAWQSNLKRHRRGSHQHDIAHSWRCLRQRSLPISNLHTPKWTWKDCLSWMYGKSVSNSQNVSGLNMMFSVKAHRYRFA